LNISNHASGHPVESTGIAWFDGGTSAWTVAAIDRAAASTNNFVIVVPHEEFGASRHMNAGTSVAQQHRTQERHTIVNCLVG
jgi:hypothetical protein